MIIFKKSEKIIVFLLFFSLLLSGLLLANGISATTNLETTYPEIQGFKPQTVKTPLPDYVKYIFNFFIATAGLIGFVALVVAGIRYLTSSGNVERLRKAKKQFIAALLGILLLLFSFLILTTINPELITFKQLTIAPAGTVPDIPDITISSSALPDPLARIKKFAETVRDTANLIDATANLIEDLTDNCDCDETTAACICEGSSSGTGGAGGGGGGGGGL